MATVYVVCAASDEAFVVDELLADLPQRGLDRWLSARQLGADGHPALGSAAVLPMGGCAAILVVVSPALAASAFAAEEVEAAFASKRLVVVVQATAMADDDWHRLPDRLRSRVLLNWPLEEDAAEARRLLGTLLPATLADMGVSMQGVGEPIRWRETRFADALKRAARRHDHAAMVALVEAFEAHVRRRGEPYPVDRARDDLKTLRQERAFELLCRYGEAVIAGDVVDATVRRFYAQGLIELQRFGEALAVLQAIIGDEHTPAEEWRESWGLTGRACKQQYVDGGPQRAQPEWLLKAIGAYASVYDKDGTQIWHGVNAASCLQRAQRDGIVGVALGRAQRIATDVLAVIDRMPQPLAVFDAASRVEALLALGRYDEAGEALDVYLAHPAMTAFEVFSTHRQFDEVLQLGKDERGAGLLQRLKDAVERYRAVMVGAAARGSVAESASEAASLWPLVIRVSAADHELGGITDLVVGTRLGTVVTARGSAQSVRELLADPGVATVQESRPAGAVECQLSLPFVRVNAHQYVGAQGPYGETGDCALIAVIDDGIDVLHEAFLDANRKSRIVGIWDQNATGCKSPPPGFAYGAFHSESDVAGYVATKTVPTCLGRNVGGHGTHVASIAAGRAAGAFAGGVAPDAKLLVVISGGSGPVGYSQTHIEALAFIQATAKERNLPVVVNVSQGMNAGAHDGKSPLEVAFDAFSGTGTVSGRVIVKSAGNEGEKGGHAKVTLSDGQCETLVWQRHKGASDRERVELWWKGNDTMRARLRDPADERSSWVGLVAGAAPTAKGIFAQGGPYEMSFVPAHADNGDSQLLIELGSAAAGASIGDWQLEIECGQAPDGGEIHAWIERAGGKPSSFTPRFADSEMTLSIPGTAASVIAVGAIGTGTPFKLGPFSSFGPTRDGLKKPIICAPGVKVLAALGGTASDVYANTGTSMAAPHVAGAIALLLSRAEKKGVKLAANQIATTLRGKAQKFTGRWDRGMGYGALDVAALLGTLDR